MRTTHLLLYRCPGANQRAGTHCGQHTPPVHPFQSRRRAATDGDPIRVHDPVRFRFPICLHDQVGALVVLVRRDDIIYDVFFSFLRFARFSPPKMCVDTSSLPSDLATKRAGWRTWYLVGFAYITELHDRSLLYNKLLNSLQSYVVAAAAVLDESKVPVHWLLLIVSCACFSRVRHGTVRHRLVFRRCA